jgi:hypothetical protein
MKTSQTLNNRPAPLLAGSMPFLGMGRSHSGNPRGMHFDTPDGQGGTGGGGTGGTGDGGTGGTGGTGGGEGGTGGTPAAFTPEQQAVLNKAIADATGRAVAPYKQKLEAYEKAEAERNAKKGGEGDKGGKEERQVAESVLQQQLADRDTKHADEIKKLNETITAMRNRDKRAAIVNAASKANAIDPGDVADLVASTVDFDGDSLVVRGEDGSIVYSGAKPMSVEEYVGSFLTKKPHLVKSSGITGGGAGGDGTKQPAGGDKPTTGLGKISAGLKKLGK